MLKNRFLRESNADTYVDRPTLPANVIITLMKTTFYFSWKDLLIFFLDTQT